MWSPKKPSAGLSFGAPLESGVVGCCNPSSGRLFFHAFRGAPRDRGRHSPAGKKKTPAGLVATEVLSDVSAGTPDAPSLPRCLLAIGKKQPEAATILRKTGCLADAASPLRDTATAATTSPATPASS